MAAKKKKPSSSEPPKTDSGILTVSSAEDARYWYKAEFITNHDGDTIDVSLDLGFRFDWTMRIRMLGINAPELWGNTVVAARLARDWLTTLLTGHSIYVRTYQDKADKYGGRWLAELFAPIVFDDPNDPKTARILDEPTPQTPLVSVNHLMVVNGFAVVYDPEE